MSRESEKWWELTKTTAESHPNPAVRQKEKDRLAEAEYWDNWDSKQPKGRKR